jgi:hypothetical protein
VRLLAEVPLGRSASQFQFVIPYGQALAELHAQGPGPAGSSRPGPQWSYEFHFTFAVPLVVCVCLSHPGPGSDALHSPTGPAHSGAMSLPVQWLCTALMPELCVCISVVVHCTQLGVHFICIPGVCTSPPRPWQRHRPGKHAVEQ